LLQLQLQIEQVDVDHIANANAQRLKHYNKVLHEQLAQLKSEIADVEIGFRINFALQSARRIEPRKLCELIDPHARLLRADLAQLHLDIRMLANRKATKNWLKTLRRHKQLLDEAEFDFDLY